MAFRTGSERPALSPFSKSVIICLLLFGAALLLYGPSLKYGFINYDDYRVLVNHPELYSQVRFVDSLRAILFECFPREEPLLVRDISWAIDGRIFGFHRPSGYHFTNVFLHGLVTALLFVFLRQTTQRMAFSALVAVLFLALAVHVEPVVWITGRKDLLATLFTLLALIFQCSELTSEGRHKVAHYGVSLLCFLLAVLSKINVAVVPAVLFLHRVLFAHLRGDARVDSPLRWRAVFCRALPLTIPYGAISLVVYRWYHGVLSAYGVLERNYTAGFAEHLWNLLKVDPMVILKYVRLIFLPAQLSLFYTWPDHTSHFSAMQVTVSLAFVAVLAVAAVALGRRRKDLAFYFFSFFVLMAPYLNLMYFGIWLANRYVYLSSFCVLAIAVSLALGFAAKFRPWARIVAGLLLTAAAVVNLKAKTEYQRAWRTSEALWRYEIGLQSTRVYAFDNLASRYYAELGRCRTQAEREQVLADVERVVAAAEQRFRPDPTQPPPAFLYTLYHIRALVSQVGGDPVDEQLKALQAAEALNGRFAPTLFELAVHFYRRGLKATGASREEAARRSLDYFRKYAQHSMKDRPALRRIDEMKAAYRADFPFLDEALPELPERGRTR